MSTRKVKARTVAKQLPCQCARCRDERAQEALTRGRSLLVNTTQEEFEMAQKNNANRAAYEGKAHPLRLEANRAARAARKEGRAELNHALAKYHQSNSILEQRLAGIRVMLKDIGEDPDREGLKDTPRRVVRAWSELTGGYKTKVKDFMTTFSAEGHDNMILCGPIQFYSTCEHHLLPFYGSAWVAYIPNDKLVGLSKLPRLVEMFSRRLQNQERMTNQIADTLFEVVDAKGAACLVTGQHLCMMARGVKQQQAVMTTTALRGAFKMAEVRAEFLSRVQ